MRWWNSKTSLLWNIIALLVFGAGAVWNIIDYYYYEGKKMDLFAGIVFGLMAIIKLTEVIYNLKERNKTVHSD
jgi:hypothetical protein